MMPELLAPHCALLHVRGRCIGTTTTVMMSYVDLTGSQVRIVGPDSRIDDAEVVEGMVGAQGPSA